MYGASRQLFTVLHAFEQENQRDTTQHHQPEHPEIVHERPQVRLMIQRVVNQAVGLACGAHGIAVPHEQGVCGGKLLPEHRVGRRQMPDHERLMRLRAARQHGGDKRDADAAAEIGRASCRERVSDTV